MSPSKRTSRETMKKRKKLTRRGSTKHPNLKPELNLKTRYELIDYDYLNDLTEKEKDYLDKFTKEYVSASFDTDNPNKNLHKTKKLRNQVYGQNNSRNRCVWTKAKASGQNLYLEEMKKGYSSLNDETFDLDDKILLKQILEEAGHDDIESILSDPKELNRIRSAISMKMRKSNVRWKVKRPLSEVDDLDDTDDDADQDS